MKTWPESVTRAVVLGAAVWVGLLTLAWLFLPAGTSTSTSADSSGQVTTSTSRQTLLESEGSSVVVVLAVPVVLVAVAVAAQGTSWRRGARTTTGALLLVGSLLGAMTIGLFYLPAAIALLVAGKRTGPLASAALGDGV